MIDVAPQVRELQDAHGAFVRDTGRQLANEADERHRKDRDSELLDEKLRGLQNDFREFALQNVYKQRAESEAYIKQQFAKHQLAQNDIVAEVRKQKEYVDEEVRGVREQFADVESMHGGFSSEAKSRLTALENAILCHNNVDENVLGDGLKLGGLAVREHLDQLRVGGTFRSVFARSSQ